MSRKSSKIKAFNCSLPRPVFDRLEAEVRESSETAGKKVSRSAVLADILARTLGGGDEGAER